MLRLVLVGMWIAVVTAGTAYFSAGLMAAKPETPGSDKPAQGLEEFVSDMTSVPVVRGGAIIGYIIIQLNYQADKAKIAELKIEPKPYLADAAFRTVYSNTETDFTRLRGSDVDQLLAAITTAANKSIGADVIKTTLVKELNYVRKEDIRTHWMNQNSGG